ncbi:MAG: hypothetical protein ACOYVK_16075 [Bacillota bacterium]
MIDKADHKKHYFNLLKTVEGTAWILCDALHTMANNHIVPEKETGNDPTSALAQNIAEIFEIIAECEDPAVIDHTADKMLEYAGNRQEVLVNYLKAYMGDNPLYKKITENKKLQ